MSAEAKIGEKPKTVNLFVRSGSSRKKLTLTIRPPSSLAPPEGGTGNLDYQSRGGGGGGLGGSINASVMNIGAARIEFIQARLANGIEIPEAVAIERKVQEISEEDLRRVNIKYPLIQLDNVVYAYAHIFYQPKSNEILYNVVEPQLDARTQALVDEVKEYIKEKIDINFTQIRKKEAYDYIERLFDRALDYFKKKFTPDMRGVLKYYIIRDFVGLERLEPLLNDKNIEDISCDGTDIPLFIYHRDPRLGSLQTNVTFQNKDELDSFVNKVAERCGRTISISKPLLDGTLPNGSRVQITLSSDVAMRGSNFTIRMFTEEPITPVNMLDFGTMDVRTLGYLWFLIEHSSSFLISGGTATGKTSMLNALSLFIKPQMKIVSIEDTAELRLPHSHWVPEVARASIAAEEGEVDMFELLRESLRQRPDYIIVGEVRGKEAYVLFQQMAVGHPGLSTIHADTLQKLIDRLTSPPISLPPGLIQNLDGIIFIKRVKIGRKYVRRIQSLIEVAGVDEKTSFPVTNEVLKWDPKTDKYVLVNKSYLLRKVSDMTGMSDSAIKDELKKRYKVLKWMYDKNIADYRKISYILNLFYSSPDALLHRLEGP